jgi:N-acetyl-gamma-glutamyl-phosphate reductase
MIGKFQKIKEILHYFVAVRFFYTIFFASRLRRIVLLFLYMYNNTHLCLHMEEQCMSQMIKVAIVGSTGYGGVELIRFLQLHPNVQISSVVSTSSSGIAMEEQYPHLNQIVTNILDGLDVDHLAQHSELVFLATPASVSTDLTPKLLQKGLKVIDLSGDFRIQSPEEYEKWYKHKSASQEELAKAVYGLSEVFAEEVAHADLVSNPGCYPTATLLGLIPAIKENWLDSSSVIVDAKSGVSGAGRGTSLGVHYAEVNENLSVYKLNRHQHIPEIEQTLGKIANQPVVITFSTHLVPMTRGIMATMYASLNGHYTEEQFIELYRNYYKNRKFVRIRNKGKWPATKEVLGSNYCDIGFSVDSRTQRVTIVSVIDNLVKGAAGQAIQNMNLMYGWDETLGLSFTPIYP